MRLLRKLLALVFCLVCMFAVLSVLSADLPTAVAAIFSAEFPVLIGEHIRSVIKTSVSTISSIVGNGVWRGNQLLSVCAVAGAAAK